MKIIRQLTLAAIAALCLCLPMGGAAAQSSLAGGSFAAYLQLLAAQARADAG